MTIGQLPSAGDAAGGWDPAPSEQVCGTPSTGSGDCGGSRHRPTARPAATTAPGRLA